MSVGRDYSLVFVDGNTNTVVEFGDVQSFTITANKHDINEILAKHTGQTYAKIAKDTERDRYLTAAQAREYGLVDEVVGHIPASEIKNVPAS